MIFVLFSDNKKSILNKRNLMKYKEIPGELNRIELTFKRNLKETKAKLLFYVSEPTRKNSNRK